jgi:DNA-directed RNA polymerase I and III subunit RPAC1
LTENTANEPPTDLNTLVFKLQVACAYKQGGPTTGAPVDMYKDTHVTSSYIVWKPQGDQLQRLSESHYAQTNLFSSYWRNESEQYAERLEAINMSVPLEEGQDPSAQLKHAIRPLFPDTLLAKLRPGQIIDLELHAEKGLGRDHAKWSPVAPASYRLMPTIDILQPIRGPDALKFRDCFPQGVIGVKEVNVAGKKVPEAVVLDARKDTVSRECLRHAEFTDKVRLGRIRDHFICTSRISFYGFMFA